MRVKTMGSDTGHFARDTAFVKGGWLALLNCQDVKVWTVLQQASNSASGICNPSIKTIADLIGHKRKAHVREILLRLAEFGLAVCANDRIYRVTTPPKLTPEVKALIARAYARVPKGNTKKRSHGERLPFPGGTKPDATPYTAEQSLEQTSGVNRRSVPNGNSKAAMPEIPLQLQTPQFIKQWDDWIAYRREMRKPLTARSASMQLEELVEIGPVKAIAVIRASIANGWQGLFPKPEQRGSNGKAKNNGEWEHKLPPPRATIC